MRFKWKKKTCKVYLAFDITSSHRSLSFKQTCFWRAYKSKQKTVQSQFVYQFQCCMCVFGWQIFCVSINFSFKLRCITTVSHHHISDRIWSQTCWVDQNSVTAQKRCVFKRKHNKQCITCYSNADIDCFRCNIVNLWMIHEFNT